jgi:hypothetical protein
MAGNYPDVPGHRIPFDRDGTIGFCVSNANVVTIIANPQMVAMNDEAAGGQPQSSGGGTNYVGLIFPRLMDLVGWWTWYTDSSTGNGSMVVQTSTDTTNGFDGTWTDRTTSMKTGVKPQYRENIVAQSVTGVRAIRIKSTHTGGPGWEPTLAMHVYGAPASGENTDRLEFWDPSSNVRVAPSYFDWGNVMRSSSADKTFRVKNLSGTQTANNVVVSVEALTDGSPSVPAQFLVSTDGTNFYSSVTITSISPGAASGVLTVRKTTPSNAQLSLWTVRMNAVATTWT